MDVTRLKTSWQQVAQYGDEVPLFFYSSLFLTHPEVRSLFPVSMAHQRDRLVGALGRIVSEVDRVDELVPFLQHLGRDHRKFAVLAEHYPAVGEALLHTLSHFLGTRWTPDLADDWTDAYGLVAKVMTEAADTAAKDTPPWWDATIVSHDRRAPDLAVMTIEPHQRLGFRPGQSLAVETPLRPNLWRYYTPANAPRVNDTIDLHVRVVGGGPVSTTLVQGVRVGDPLRLGPPVGERLTLNGHDDAVLIAGGTGLAPFKAIIDQVRTEGGDRRVYLFAGGPTVRSLYDLRALRALSEAHPWLRVIPCVSREAASDGIEGGDAVDVALRHGPWRSESVYVCGSPDMVAGSVHRLAEHGLPRERVHVEEFTTSTTSTGGIS
ncbi:globin domain-containing protein [Nocardiopsis sediminis]|uniref:nitric oxide dioxygenase n=1 Tax=Nocardiopsis sediminis TaxID=1778267 RepID=A0ABV8FLL7_9ACTN